MSKRISKDGERGAVMVEFAIMMPLLLFMTLGFVQLALIFSARSVLNYASFMAARAEVVGEDSKKSAELIMSAVAGPTLFGGGSPGIEIPGWGELARSASSIEKTRTIVIEGYDSDEKFVTVRVEHDYELIFPNLSSPFLSGDDPFKSFSRNQASFITLSDECTLAKPWK